MKSRQSFESRNVGLEGYTSQLANKRLEFTHGGRKQEIAVEGKSEEGGSCLPWHLPKRRLNIWHLSLILIKYPFIQAQADQQNIMHIMNDYPKLPLFKCTGTDLCHIVLSHSNKRHAYSSTANLFDIVPTMTSFTSNMIS